MLEGKGPYTLALSTMICLPKAQNYTQLWIIELLDINDQCS